MQSAISEIFEASKPLNLNPFRYWFTVGQQNKEMLEFCKARDIPEDEWTLSWQLAQLERKNKEESSKIMFAKSLAIVSKYIGRKNRREESCILPTKKPPLPGRKFLGA